MKKIFVIYLMTFSNGQFYIGKTNNPQRRLKEHIRNSLRGHTLKESAIKQNPFRFDIIEIAPSHLSDSEKEKWIDEMEKIKIHEFAEKTLQELTGVRIICENYTKFKHIINKKMLNEILY